MTNAHSHRPVKSAAVLGAGTMGAQIAAHLANAGVKVLLLDIPAKEGDRNSIAKKGLDTAIKSDPAAFFGADVAPLVSIGNFDDDLPKVKGCDWIVEAVVERADIKQSLFARLEPHLAEGAVITSNTSGIPIKELAAGRSDAFRRSFFGTHFFNPPRYMHLLEVIPGPETDPAVLARIEHFCDVRLGKGLVRAKDTPNFIANRIGIFGALRALQAFSEEGLTFGEVDRITGPLVGRAKSATFRTFDLVGLDVVLHVARNVYDAATTDERRDVFVAPDFVQRMCKEGRLGDKTAQGFYKKVKEGGQTVILALDPVSFEYRPQEKPKLPSLEMVSQMEDLGDRLRALVFGKDRVGAFLQKTLLETLVYAGQRLPEIAESVVDVDRAMVWGFGWSKGPFETWDMLGIEKTLPHIEARGLQAPQIVRDLLSSGQKSFYVKEPGTRRFFDLSGKLATEALRDGVTVLASLKEREKVVKKNGGASVVDLGDGVCCVEFHSKMNAIGGDTIAMLKAGLAALETDFDAMVVANDGDNFCVGANLMLLLLEAQEGNFDEVDLMVRQFQKATMALKTAPKPVVVAPFGMTLGGGLEVTLHGAGVQAAAESYMGLVELGVGLIPAGGGTKELLLRMLDRVPAGGDVFPAVRAAFETIGLAKVGKSAHEGRALGFLRSGDGISMNRERLTEDAKALALSMAARSYTPYTPRTDVPAMGATGLATLKMALHGMRRAGQVSDYDQHLGVKLSHVLTGGSLSRATTVTEERLLDLEREAFLSLCGERRTLERIQCMLKTGKPLRN